MRVLYSESNDFTPPAVVAAAGTPGTGTATLQVQASDPSGIVRVLALVDVSAGWAPVDLTPSGGLWEATVPVAGDPATLRWVVQVVDGAGNVGWGTNGGAGFGAIGEALDDPGAPDDVIAPNVTGEPDRAANAAGWYDAPVTIDWVSVDPAPSSGTPTDPPDTVIDTEGSAVTVESAPSCDPAGNCATGSVTVAIDVTDPVVAVTGFTDGASFELGSEPTVGCTTSDALSGVAVDATVAVTGGDPDGTGTFTATCSGATDVAGNTAGPVGASYEVQAVTPLDVIAPNVTGEPDRAGEWGGLV